MGTRNDCSVSSCSLSVDSITIDGDLVQGGAAQTANNGSTSNIVVNYSGRVTCNPGPGGGCEICIFTYIVRDSTDIISIKSEGVYGANCGDFSTFTLSRSYSISSDLNQFSPMPDILQDPNTTRYYDFCVTAMPKNIDGNCVYSPGTSYTTAGSIISFTYQ